MFQQRSLSAGISHEHSRPITLSALGAKDAARPSHLLEPRGGAAPRPPALTGLRAETAGSRRERRAAERTRGASINKGRSTGEAGNALAGEALHELLAAHSSCERLLLEALLREWISHELLLAARELLLYSQELLPAERIGLRSSDELLAPGDEALRGDEALLPERVCLGPEELLIGDRESLPRPGQRLLSRDELLADEALLAEWISSNELLTREALLTGGEASSACWDAGEDSLASASESRPAEPLRSGREACLTQTRLSSQSAEAAGRPELTPLAVATPQAGAVGVERAVRGGGPGRPSRGGPPRAELRVPSRGQASQRLPRRRLAPVGFDEVRVSERPGAS